MKVVNPTLSSTAALGSPESGTLLCVPELFALAGFSATGAAGVFPAALFAGGAGVVVDGVVAVILRDVL